MASVRPLTHARRLRKMVMAALKGREHPRSRAEQMRAEIAVSTSRHQEMQAQVASVLYELGAQADRLDTLTQRLEELRGQLGAMATEHSIRNAAEAQFRSDTTQALRWIHAEERWHRTHLRDRRRTGEYDRAFTEPDPLVSVVIPTYDNLDLLRTRAIPSILGQTHTNVEIVIVGDAAPYSAAEVTAGFERAPIRFTNRTTRGQYPTDRDRRWLVAGAPPFNEGMAAATGLWIAPFADDDEMRPEHLSTLLRHAVEHRLEFVYGLLNRHEPEPRVIGEWPPRLAHIGLQASLMHRDLSIFELELADADFDVPSDWGRVERMLRAGVRVGMVDEIVVDYYPSMRAQTGG